MDIFKYLSTLKFIGVSMFVGISLLHLFLHAKIVNSFKINFLNYFAVTALKTRLFAITMLSKQLQSPREIGRSNHL